MFLAKRERISHVYFIKKNSYFLEISSSFLQNYLIDLRYLTTFRLQTKLWIAGLPLKSITAYILLALNLYPVPWKSNESDAT